MLDLRAELASASKIPRSSVVHSRIEVRSFAKRVGAWLDAKAPEADVVISCRVRLARNLEGYPFQARLEPARAMEVAERLHTTLHDARIDGETWWVPVAEAPAVLRLMLLERNLASRDLVDLDAGAEASAGRAIAFGESETVSVMVNEEDHVRLSALAAGFDLDLAWQRALNLDRYLEERLTFACSKSLGYLTACPTNVGTGLRASVMLHLPGLGLASRELQKVFNAAKETGLAVRGMHGEGSRTAGDLYQISNQVTLGRSEGQLIGELARIVPRIIAFERDVRAALVAKHRGALRDRIAHAYATLRTARSLPSDEALFYLSTLRFGVCLGLFEQASLDDLGRLGMQVQQGHVQVLCNGDPKDLAEASERDKLRASFLRERLAR